jgi:methylenetetrahydrofolate reductase (NADPH)
MTFEEKLNNNQFVYTAELFPPKGTDLSKLVSKAKLIKPFIDCVNVTDNQRAVMRVGGIAVSKTLVDMGIEPIFQLTARDRNRLALQSDLLGASILGVKNVLLLAGDYPTLGDHKEAMPVYDVDTVQLITLANTLKQGTDLNGKELKGKPDLFIGATTNPNLMPAELQLIMMEKKIKAGAQFFQTQVCFDLDSLQPFIDLAKQHNVKILPSISIFRSYNQMEHFKEFGIKIPNEYLQVMKQTNDPLQASIEIVVNLIKQLKKIADGVHIIAINIEEHIPKIFELL